MKPLVQHTVEFFLDTTLVIGLLHFKESKRNTIDKDVDIRAKRPLRFRAKGQFVNDSKIVIFGMVKVNELDVCGLVQQSAQKLLTHIIVLNDAMDFLNRCQNLLDSQVLITVDSLDCRNKTVEKDSGFGVDIRILQRLVLITQPHELYCCGKFYSHIFIPRNSHLLMPLSLASTAIIILKGQCFQRDIMPLCRGMKTPTFSR